MVAVEYLETSFEDWTFGARTAKVDEQSDLQSLEFSAVEFEEGDRNPREGIWCNMAIWRALWRYGDMALGTLKELVFCLYVGSVWSRIQG